jgi:tetratricopeptide (TPR) repeat protein
MSGRTSELKLSAVTGNARERRSDFIWALSLLAATLLVYAQVWGFAFITIDDPAYVPQNRHVREGLTVANVVWSFTSVHDANWIPLTWLSLMLDTEIYGLRPGGYHFTNVLLHAASTVVLFVALKRATGRAGRSAFVAALFALHPLHVESVAWVAERKDVLSTLFGLLALDAYLRYATGSRLGAYAASLSFFVLSLLAKQTLVTLPFVFLLLDFWPLRRLGAETRAIAEKIPFFTVTVAFCAIAMFAQADGGALRSLSRSPLATRAQNALLVYAAYLEKAFDPQNLAVYYPHPGAGIRSVAVALSAAVLLAVTAFALVSIRRYPFVLVGWCWYLGTLVPMIGLVQIGTQQMADRYTYFPLIGIFLAVGWLVPELFPASFVRVRLLRMAGIGCVVVCAAISFRQIGYWRDSVTLLRHSMECTPDNSVAHEFLGNALLAEGAVAEGVSELEVAVRLAPRYVPLRFALGDGLQQLKLYDEAAEQYRAVLAIDDSRAEAHAHLGRIALKTGHYAEAVTESERALHFNPHLLKCHRDIALGLRAQGRLDEAIGRLRRLVALAPDDQEAKDELSQTLAMKQHPTSP